MNPEASIPDSYDAQTEPKQQTEMNTEKRTSPGDAKRENVEVVIRHSEEEYTHLDSSKGILDVRFDTATRVVTIKEFNNDPDVVEANLIVIIKLGSSNSKFMGLEELRDGSLLLSLFIPDSGKIHINEYRHGFTNNYLLSELAQTLMPPKEVKGMQILLPATHIPWRWTAALILMTFGWISTRQCHNMRLLHKSLQECRARINECRSLLSISYTAEEVAAAEAEAEELLAREDAVGRQGWVKRFEKVVDTLSLVKVRDQWIREAQRLKGEYLAIVQLITVHTRGNVNISNSKWADGVENAAAPKGPEAWKNSVTPTNQDASKDPVTPKKPTTPGDPVTPTNQETPKDPETPKEPVTPKQPATPGDPVTPTDPETPKDPETPMTQRRVRAESRERIDMG